MGSESWVIRATDGRSVSADEANHVKELWLQGQQLPKGWRASRIALRPTDRQVEQLLTGQEP